MGLKDKLTTTGSPLSPANGGAIATNPLATSTSPLHSDGTTGYSLDGANQGVSNLYAQYNDGVSNSIPQPTRLDMEDPTSSTTFNPSNKYSDNLPQ